MEDKPVASFNVSLMPQEVRSRVANLVVTVNKNCVYLEGKTNSYYVKQMAQEAVKKYMPEAEIENRIHVEY